jgi:hypothetical protein
MSNALSRAVTDGPAGLQVVALSDDRYRARRLRFDHRGHFWCSTEAGGCGARLVLAVGELVRPYFRHVPGAPCIFSNDVAKAERSYEHLDFQRELTRWLQSQGYSPELEKHLGADGRADLHVRVDEVSQTIEVQLSPLSSATWQERDQRYRRKIDCVTWLFGRRAKEAARVVASGRGFATTIGRSPLTGTVRLGVLDVDGQVRWSELKDCRLTARGLEVPGIADALELHGRRETERLATEHTEESGRAVGRPSAASNRLASRGFKAMLFAALEEAGHTRVEPRGSHQER